MPATVWRGRLAFGMVSIPVRMYKAARRERVRFHHVYRPAEAASEKPVLDEPEFEPEPPAPITSRGGAAPQPSAPPPIDEEEPVARVRNAPFSEPGGGRIEASEVLKGFEVEKGRYVVMEPREVAALRPRTSTEVEIARFVRMEEVDPLFLDVSYFLQPDGKVEKPYALLYRALESTGYAAMGSIAMHGREHPVLIRPGKRGLVLHTLFHASEVRLEEEHAPDTAEVTEKELRLATTLVRALAEPFDASILTDRFEEKLHALIESRTPVPEAGSGKDTEKRAPVMDIMEALRRSLEAARKPPASEAAPKRRTRKA